ncbi:hypothetical protein BC834DRAFT_976986 [Gloeopeniophorella convolvens]|nr:hypothetical protein BC834DRAFT_976986 [Gloeopeniophorella convolvens]
MPSEVTLLVHLNTERPLSGPKWIKSGDVQDWLKSTFGHMFWVVGDAAEGWEKKIEVADPDPAPTIWTVLDGWAVNPPVGLHTERQGLHYVLWLQDIVAHSRGVHNSDTAAVHDIDVRILFHCPPSSVHFMTAAALVRLRFTSRLRTVLRRNEALS